LLLVETIDVRDRRAILMTVGLAAKLGGGCQQAKLDVADRRPGIGRLDPDALLLVGYRAQPPPLAHRAQLPDAARPGQTLLAHEPQPDAVERAGLDRPQAGGAEPLLQLDPGVSVERGTEDLRSGRPAAQELPHALDQDRRFAAPCGGDDLDDAVVGERGPALLGVEADGAGRHPAGDSRLGAWAKESHGGVERAVQGVRILKLRIHEPLWRQLRQPVLALYHQRCSVSQRRLEHVAVKRD
jgi:hypothetical protein